MRLHLFSLVAAGLAVALIAVAQTPTPMPTSPLPAATPVPEAAAATPRVSKNVDADVIAAIQLLQELKAKNEQTLKKQQATLELLDQLQQDAEQLKIFSKRG